MSFVERSYRWPKCLQKIKALFTLIFAVYSCKKELFLLYIKMNIFFMQCLYGYVIVTLKLSCKDIPRSMTSRANESWFKCKNLIHILNLKCEFKFWLNRCGLCQQTRADRTSSQVIFFIDQWFWHFHFLCGPYKKGCKLLTTCSFR